jgi:hypothetical protein
MSREPTLITDPHPEVQRWVEYETWPAEKPFPLTPLEAWYVLQGYAVRPAAGMTQDQLYAMPGRVEGGVGGPSGWIVLRGMLSMKI